MTTQTEALKLALEALEVATTPLTKDRQEVLQAITAINKVLAQPERKPLTDEQVWNDDELMKLNAVMMLPMDYFMRVVHAVEAAHGIKE